MWLRFWIVLFATGLALEAPVLAEEVKLPPLSDFQWKPAFEGAQELGGYDPAEQRFYFYTNGSAVAEINTFLKRESTPSPSRQVVLKRKRNWLSSAFAVVKQRWLRNTPAPPRSAKNTPLPHA